MKEQTLAQWQEEMESRFPSTESVSFVCPACGRVSTVADIVAAGGDENDAPQQCIGRLNGKGSSNGKDEGFGCDWAAFGFFGTLGKGRKIMHPDGHTSEVFEFADKKETEAPQNEITQA